MRTVTKEKLTVFQNKTEANSNIQTKESNKTYNPKDFLLTKDDQSPVQPQGQPETFLTNLKSIFKLNNSAITQVSVLSSSSKDSTAPFISKNRVSTDDGSKTVPKHPINMQNTKNTSEKQNSKVKSSRIKLLTKKSTKKTHHESDQPSSYLFLGGWDNTLFSGDLQFHPVIRKSWWTLNLEKVLLDGEDTGLCNKHTKCEIIMDSGASLMATPPQLFAEFMESVGGDRFCGDLSKYPTISFVLDDLEYSIDPFEYILSNHEDIDYSHDNEKADCMVGFSVFDLGPDEFVWIAGDIFLSKYFSVYDREFNQVGLAPAL